MSEPVYHVMVVEDDPHLAAGVVENLRAEGYEVDTVGDGRKAVEWFESHSCDLIILDVMLPGMDGFAVCSTLRARGTTTPVLFLTARGDAVDRIRGLEAGGDDYLAKPFHLQEFLLACARSCAAGTGTATAAAPRVRMCSGSPVTKWTSAPSAAGPGTARPRN